MRILLILAGLFLAYTQVGDILHSLKKPAAYENGEYFCGKDYMYNPDTGLCGPIFEELEPEIVAETTTGTSTSTTETEPEAELPFEPLPFNGKTSKFVKQHGGEVVKIDDDRKWSAIKHYKIAYKPKGVLVNGDFYWTAKDGTNYVIHKGKLIKL